MELESIDAPQDEDDKSSSKRNTKKTEGKSQRSKANKAI